MQLKLGDRVVWVSETWGGDLMYAKVISPSSGPNLPRRVLVEWEDTGYGYSNILEDELVKICQRKK